MVLFVGGDFDRKGGPLVREIASRSEFSKYQFVYVTAEQFVPGPNERNLTGIGSDSPELMQLMRRASLLVLPTRADCSAIVVAEAAASGTPSVVSNVGGVPELVDHDQSGLIISERTADAFAEGILRYLREPELSISHGLAARSRAEANHDLNKQVALIKDLIP